MQYFIEDFWLDCYSFNRIAGKDQKNSHADLCKQFKLIAEELKETADGLATNNPKEVLDGTIDVLVTTIGMLQKLETLGFDIHKAMDLTALNNLSKYPFSEIIAIESAEMYDKQGIDVQVTYNSELDVFVIKDENDKIRKPSNFVSNDLSECLPEDYKHSFKDWKPVALELELKDE